jgi:D-alanyl-lipoteichoic acid acyltransferase DltB (MBOAT superfamily)
MPPSSDGAFVVILLGSVVGSAVLRLVPGRSRATLSAAAGAALICAACEPYQVLHLGSSLLLGVLSWMLCAPAWRGSVCMLLTFAHLGGLRVMGVATGPANAALLVLVLRLIAGNSDRPTDAPKTVADFVLYACCYQGLFTAPFYTYTQWNAAMRAPAPFPSVRTIALDVLRSAVVFAVWRALAWQLPFHVALDDSQWMHTSPWARPLHFYASSYQFRWRFYACWVVMEASGRLAGFAEPSNVDILGCELATSPSAYIASWNVSVQGWLKQYVYRRLPKRTPRELKQLVTFAASAYWHGIHPGYYLCFAFMLLMVAAEGLLRSAAAQLPPALTALHSGEGVTATISSLVCHLWTMWCFSFAGIAFNLLQWSDTFRMWSALGQYGFWLLLVPTAMSVPILFQGPRARGTDMKAS